MWRAPEGIWCHKKDSNLSDQVYETQRGVPPYVAKKCTGQRETTVYPLQRAGVGHNAHDASPTHLQLCSLGHAEDRYKVAEVGVEPTGSGL